MLRTGDRAIIIGALAICAYEKLVADDADLISSRVSAYRQHMIGRLVTDAVILATALHLAEALEPEFDVFHIAMKHLRRNVGGEQFNPSPPDHYPHSDPPVTKQSPVSRRCVVWRGSFCVE